MKNGTSTIDASPPQAPVSAPLPVQGTAPLPTPMRQRMVPRFRNGAPVEPEVRLDKEIAAQWMTDNSMPELKSHQCVQFLVVHRTEKGMEPVTQCLPIPKTTGPAERRALCKDIAERFDRASYEWARTFPREQSFAIQAFVKAQSDMVGDGVVMDSPRDSFPFTVSPPPETSQNFYQRDENNASTSAIIGHLQRQNSDLTRAFSSNMQAAMDRISEHNVQLLNTVDRVLGRNLELSSRLEESLDARMLREATAKEKETEILLKRELVMKLAPYAGPLLAGIIGKLKGNSQPSHSHGAPELVEAQDVRVSVAGPVQLLEAAQALEPKQLARLWRDLSDEQKKKFYPVLQTMAGSMSAEQQAELVSLIQASDETKEASE